MLEKHRNAVFVEEPPEFVRMTMLLRMFFFSSPPVVLLFLHILVVVLPKAQFG